MTDNIFFHILLNEEKENHTNEVIRFNDFFDLKRQKFTLKMQFKFFTINSFFYF
jgi:hypothetical protein